MADEAALLGARHARDFVDKGQAPPSLRVFIPKPPRTPNASYRRPN